MTLFCQMLASFSCFYFLFSAFNSVGGLSALSFFAVYGWCMMENYTVNFQKVCVCVCEGDGGGSLSVSCLQPAGQNFETVLKWDQKHKRLRTTGLAHNIKYTSIVLVAFYTKILEENMHTVILIVFFLIKYCRYWLNVYCILFKISF